MLYRPTINLLPDTKKNQLQNLVRFIFAKDLLETMLLFYSLLAIIFVWSWLALQEDYNNMAQSATLVNRESSTTNREVRNVNNIIRQFNLSTANYIQTTPVLKHLIETTPSNIKINSLIFNRAQKQLTISGIALTRDDLLNYENIIKTYSWTKKYTTPISQLLQKENINFEIRVQADLSEPIAQSEIISNTQAQ